MEKVPSYQLEEEVIDSGETPSAPFMAEEEEAQAKIERPVFPNPHKDFEYNEIVKPLDTKPYYDLKPYHEPKHHCQSAPVQPTTIIIQTSPSPAYPCCTSKKCNQVKNKKTTYLPYIAGVIISIFIIGYFVTYLIKSM